MRVLGVSGTYHDAAAALLVGGQIVGAAQEERFTRVRHDPSLPEHAIRWLASVSPGPLDALAFYDKPLLTLHRALETAIAVAPRGLRVFLDAMPSLLGEKLWTGADLKGICRRAGLPAREIYFPEHHESHAASAFFPSPFERAAVLTVDGVGEWASATIGRGEGSTLALLDQQDFPHSVGLLYAAATYHCGFKVNSGEYKLMGLAPFGEPTFVDALMELVALREDGSFRLDMRAFSFLDDSVMTSPRFAARFGPPRSPEAPLTKRDLDLACSAQRVTEEIVLRMVRRAVARTGCRDVCMAGGVALNAVANGRIVRERVCDRLWVQPAAGDAGGALGAALAVWHGELGGARVPGDQMRGARLGPAFSQAEVAAWLDAEGVPYAKVDADGVADRLAAGRVIGRFDGPMEWGPRALGGRSILADPRRPEIHRTVNHKVKFREGFRPFAPVVLAERAAEWFDLDVPSPYMLLVAPVLASRRKAAGAADALDLLGRVLATGSEIPAVTHVDGSARLQTVTGAEDAGLAAILRAFEARTGCPVLLNTSFNVRGEPIVCTPEDALEAFLRTDIDDLVIEGLHLEKAAMDPARMAKARERVFAPD